MTLWIAFLDTRVLQEIVAHRLPWLTHTLVVISFLGEWTPLIAGALAIAAVYYLKKRRRAEAVGLLIATLGTGASVAIVKQIVARPRPDIGFRLVSEPGYSFPSSHAALSLAFFGFIAYLALHERPRQKWFALLMVPLLIFLVGFSRLYLGVHYVSDVVAGYLIGGAFLWTGIQVTKKLRR